MNTVKDYLFANQQHYHGEVDVRFIDLAAHFSRLQDSRRHAGGAGLTVYFQNEKVLDIYTGMKSQQEEWQSDTLSVCYSTGKGVLATLAHILVSHGVIEYDVPIANYWPEFSQNAKEKITLKHILTHQSGLYDIRNLIGTASEMADWPHMLKMIEQASPRFEVAQASAYQALTFGWLVGGVLEKATKVPLASLLNTYLVDALELDGAYFGMPPTELIRVAKPLNFRTTIQKEQTDSTLNAKSKPKKTGTKLSVSEKLIEFSGQNPQDFLDAMVPKGMKNFSFFDDDSLQQPIPAANGVFTTRSLAKIYAMLANQGQWQDNEIIKPEIFEKLSQIYSYKRDRVMPIPMHWRLGYHRVITLGKRVKQGFGHIGYNGSGAWCDPERQLSFAYTHNFPVGSITGDYRLWGLSQEAIRCADLALKGKKGWF